MVIELGSDMQNYVWTLNGQAWPLITPLIFSKGDPVEFIFRTANTMRRPMDFQRNVFRVVAIDEEPINGAMRDAVLLPPKASLSIQFDAPNPGLRPLHSHVFYDLEAGLITVVRDRDFQQFLH